MKELLGMDRAEIETQVGVDVKTLQAITPILDDLERRWLEARKSVGARTRGYFTPEEDDLVRQLLLSYRNCRIELINIIQRCWAYPALPWPQLQLRMFLTGFATGLMLYAKSLQLIRTYEHVPLVRAKMNEPDSRFDMPSGFFDELIYSYSSLSHFQGLKAGRAFWRQHRRELKALFDGRELPGEQATPGQEVTAEARWLMTFINGQRKVVRQRLATVLLLRLRYDWQLFVTTVLKPLTNAKHGLESFVTRAGAKLRTTTSYRPCIKPSAIEKLSHTLKPGDVLLVRSEKKLTSALLPGFWTHAALYVGTSKDLIESGLIGHPHVRKYEPWIRKHENIPGIVVEAISPAVRITTLSRALFVDHVLVLRPVLPEADIKTAIGDAFGHVDKAYDYEFDFNVTTRIVCTELIYRCYHSRGAIQLPLVKRLGRFTLTGDDMAQLAIRDLDRGIEAFRPESMILGTQDNQCRFVDPSDVAGTLKRIQSGWRPCETKDTANV